jgi:FkbM family methyltransferase
MHNSKGKNMPIKDIPPIKEWVTNNFSDLSPKTFFEIGAHTGNDSKWMSALPGVTLHAFEPDPRNDISHLPDNVIKNKCAVSNIDGHTKMILSTINCCGLWTQSSSLLKPKNHLTQWPDVEFGKSVDVKTTTLDMYCIINNIGIVDFIWADTQGAEGDMIRGAFDTLKRTRYLYTEFSNYEMYDGQPNLNDILRLLPGWEILKIYETSLRDDNVLLQNKLIYCHND